MKFHIITLFPEMFNSYLSESILARAQREKKIEVFFYNPREFVEPTGAQRNNPEPYLRVDDKPYGGGPGMVMQAGPLVLAIENALAKIERKESHAKIKILFLAPGGEEFNTAYAKKIQKKYTDIVIVSGRYEGIDERVRKIFKAEKVSVGPYVVTGGELPAMIIMDCISRQIEGVLGNFDSREEERVASQEVYTRPEIFEYKGKKYKVPKVLLSGNHKEIEEWRKKGKR